MAPEQGYAVRKVFVVVDPKRFVQPALEKAEWVAERNQASLHVYSCAYDPRVAFDHQAKQAVVGRTRAWLERICAADKDKHILVTVQVEWDPEWTTKIVNAALASKADLIVKTAAKRPRIVRYLLKRSDWRLITNAVSPTLFVNANQAIDNKKPILAALKLEPGDEAHVALAERVINMGHRVAGALNTALHAVTVHEGNGTHPDGQHLADSWRLPRERVHAADGSPHEEVAKIAERIGAGVLVVGCAGRETRDGGGIVTNMAQRIIEEVNADVVVVPQSVTV